MVTKGKMASSTNLAPLSVVFDDLMKHYDMCIEHDTTNEFLEFVNNQEECRVKWNNAETECQRLQTQLQNRDEEISRMDKKIQEIRKHLEGKMELLNKAELEKDRLAGRNKAARDLIKAYLKDGKMSSDTKEKMFNILGILEGDRTGVSMLKSPALGLDTISEDGGTTDLSMTQSEDDLDLSVGRGRRRGKRASLTREDIQAKRSRHASGNKSDVHNAEQLIAKTVVSFPKDGPIHAVATLETYPGVKKSVSSPSYHVNVKPSAPPMPPTTASESESDAVPAWVQKGRSSPAVLLDSRHHNVPGSSNQSPRFGRTLSSGGPMAMRPHAFCQKTVIKPETCEPCGKRIKFSKVAYKCRDCKATCHPECKDKVPIPCVSTGTPSSNKHQMGALADYVPAQHPMVPGLIQHCVNEIEIRGLDTAGLYRVPGSEREVKELKEKFLKGKGVPTLGRYDIHAICGCVKDFLRSLQEPLVGRWFWQDFVLASDYNDPIKRQAEFERIINDLPLPNQDTLAFMMLHLLRVSESPEVKMPIGNLAKIFGPTIVGYSDQDIEPAVMLKETKKQQQVLETLLNISAEFWRKFAYRPEEANKIYNNNKGSYNKAKAKTLQSPYTPQGPPSISSVDRVRNNGKRIYFTDDSPKESGIKTRSQKRNFFD